MRFSSSRLLVLLQVVLLSAAAPSRFDAFAVKEEVYAPHGWTKYGEPPADHVIALRIGLPQPNFDVVEQHLWEISDPDHARYGQHLSKEEAEDLVRPPPESSKAVHDWLADVGVKAEHITPSPAGDWLTISLPVHHVEKILNTKYHVWAHEASGDYIVRTTKYSLPAYLHEHIDVIQPTTMFGRLSRHSSTIFDIEDAEEQAPPMEHADAKLVNNQDLIHDPKTGITINASCNSTITISCLQQLYNAEGFEPATSHRHGVQQNSIGITGYLEQFANIQDLQSFYAEQRPDALNSSFNFISVAGGINDQNLSRAGGEANLDVQFAFGLSHPIPATFFSTAGRPPFIPDAKTTSNTNEPYLDWLQAVTSKDNVPLVISTSYGDDEQTVPESFARRVCQGFALLGTRGVSLVFSSGDGGVGDGRSNPATQQCFTNDGTNATRFIPTFPSSCPFVTSVGGTDNILPEVAVSRFFSGGGFSNYFERPAYQTKAVNDYLHKHLSKGTYEGLFNPQGRGFPDVAAQGDRFRVWVGGSPHSIGGTSASSPAFAGIVALLNDARLQAGKPPLGFLNPMLYSKGFQGLTDILSGHNSGCGTLGFNVTEGWDPVTGLGTPNFGKLKEIVLK